MRPTRFGDSIPTHGNFYEVFTDNGKLMTHWKRMKNILFACGLLAGGAQALEVHEWGTFTVLSGSTGNQVQWYSPFSDITGLPAFVHPGLAFGGKTLLNHRIRMETPVIYFYPEKPMQVSVEANFVNGQVTETFPYSPVTFSSVAPGGRFLIPGSWAGKLLPPTDKTALSRIPAIPAANHEEPYGAAREVPDAWIFESDVKQIPGRKEMLTIPETEKFIFYRGAGDAYLPISASTRGDQVHVHNNALGPLPFGTALRVRGSKASWAAIPRVSPLLVDGKPTLNMANVTLPPADGPLDEVESELAAAWQSALAKDGLTTAEASAMVETWRRTWFREEGDRVLTLVPRATIDQMLTLKITPQPEKTERVFVARIEMISPDREDALVRLLNSTNKSDATQVAELDNIALGRFSQGAMEVAIDIKKNTMMQKFHELKAIKDMARMQGASLK
jgi:hypothetical protein